MGSSLRYFEGHGRAAILRIAIPLVGIGIEATHAGLVALRAVGWAVSIQVEPGRIIVSAVAAGSIPEDVGACLCEGDIVFYLGRGFSAASAIGDKHGHPARWFTSGWSIVDILDPKPVEIAIIGFGFPDDKTLGVLQEVADAVESCDGRSCNRIGLGGPIGQIFEAQLILGADCLVIRG